MIFACGLNVIAALLVGIVGSLMISSARPVLGFIDYIKMGITSAPKHVIENITTQNYLD